MSKLILSFSISLDGFVAGSGVSVEEPMGKDGERLHDWIFSSDDPIDKEMAGELAPTLGAVLVGRRTFDVGLGPWGDTPFPVPTFVLTHEKRAPLPMKSGTFTFVTDGIESALEQAHSAAAGKNIVVMGAETARLYLTAGRVDEITLQLVPILLGNGTRLFAGESMPEFAPVRAIASPVVTHLKFARKRP
ncbi:Dihydrofolate reductase [Mesorhizobium albiziae]|uniref:Dihydrofolate reductase n=1 Tax=Neomesorhizobium albiziae TaxID=335020 RepID=A0A1I4BDK9_9HYPH|nr:dihydrofolate reductase family protein [Mesorhizobium albiziae]GLS29811.1 deaminase reductase [Mesorhizobium albiziae]SFK66875.1 Dihydrofolate reductase [Mesorhizobium albiziae]